MGMIGREHPLPARGPDFSRPACRAGFSPALVDADHCPEVSLDGGER